MESDEKDKSDNISESVIELNRKYSYKKFDKKKIIDCIKEVTNKLEPRSISVSNKKEKGLEETKRFKNTNNIEKVDITPQSTISLNSGIDSMIILFRENKEVAFIIISSTNLVEVENLLSIFENKLNLELID
ncbi:MAG: hypothetical protein ACOCRZ_06350 [Halothermotrichaceae bacterium]